MKSEANMGTKSPEAQEARARGKKLKACQSQ